MVEFKKYLVNWTDIYDIEHKNLVDAKNQSHAEYAIPSGDILSKINKIEEVFWNKDLGKFLPKTSQYNSKVPVYEGINADFIEYSSEYVPNQGEITNFDDAHKIALNLLKERPNTALLVDESGLWWVGKIDSVLKHAYFQGTEEPTPKKKKYKSDKAIVVQPRFKEPLYKNFDLYETEGADGKAKHGPGAGLYQNLDKYKSVSEFRKKKKTNKYKADDSWIEDSGKIVKHNKIHRRMAFLKMLIKTAIDFPIDDQITPILGDRGTYSDSVPIGGRLDNYLPLNDFEDKSPDQLNFGRDYICESCGFIDTNRSMTCPECGEDRLDQLTNKYINPAEPHIYGLPDGILPVEDLDAPNDEDPDYGTTNSGNTLYNKMWI